MEKNNGIDRSPKNHENEDIYRCLPEREVDKLSDEEFLRLRELFRRVLISYRRGIPTDETGMDCF